MWAASVLYTSVMAPRPETLAPSRVVGRRVREIREERRWSQERLATELADVGIKIGQTDVARLEKQTAFGKPARSVSVEDLMAIAFVLDVPPLALLAPIQDEEVLVVPAGARPLLGGPVPIQVGPGGQAKAAAPTSGGEPEPVTATGALFRAWFVGRVPLLKQRRPIMFLRFGRQDPHDSGIPHLGAPLRKMAEVDPETVSRFQLPPLRTVADELDVQDVDRQEQVLQALRAWLDGSLAFVRLVRANRQDARGEAT